MRHALAITLLASGVVALAQDKDVEMKTVSYADLGKAIRAHKGKVVVVDLWGSWCVPCIKKFPAFVALEAKYRGKDVVCISVAMENPGDGPKAVGWLKKLKAGAVTNYLLDDGIAANFKKFSIETVPVVFVFDKENRRAARFVEDEKPFTYEDDVEPLVAKLLGK